MIISREVCAHVRYVYGKIISAGFFRVLRSIGWNCKFTECRCASIRVAQNVNFQAQIDIVIIQPQVQPTIDQAQTKSDIIKSQKINQIQTLITIYQAQGAVIHELPRVLLGFKDQDVLS